MIRDVCRPGRAPVHRDGVLYELDPHDDELDLWLFILGLRPARVPQLSVVRPKPEALAGPDQALSTAELEEAFDDQYLGSAWSAQRLALAVLDAHGTPMAGEQVVAVLDRLADGHILKIDAARYWRRNAAVLVEEDERWTYDREHRAVRGMRVAVRERIEVARRHRGNKPDPAVVAASRKRFEKQEAEAAAELARLRRCLLHTFPPSAPVAATLIDEADREVSSFSREEFDALRARLGGYDLIAGVDVRATLRALDVEVGARRLHELGPPQKTRKVGQAGRPLKITLQLLIKSSCGIARPLGDAKQLRRYVEQGKTAALSRRLEADARALLALYDYGRLHGGVRLRWRSSDEMLPVSWHHRKESSLNRLMRDACKQLQVLEVVVGQAPEEKDPWLAARRCVAEEIQPFELALIDEEGEPIDPWDVQLARVAEDTASDNRWAVFGAASRDEAAQRKAQELIWRAFELDNELMRSRMARQALELWADCADAYVLLAQASPSRKETLELYRKGVAAGERSLGTEFDAYVGHFWGILETRPYMRARAGLAGVLWNGGKKDEAIAHYRELLRLNPGDNQGLRYVLLDALVNLDREAEAVELLEAYQGDEMAAWTYHAALLAFRREGDSASARARLRRAMKGNPHVRRCSPTRRRCRAANHPTSASATRPRRRRTSGRTGCCGPEPRARWPGFVLGADEAEPSVTPG